MMRQITFTLFLIFSCSLWAQSNPLKLTMKEAEELFRTHNLLLVAEYYNVDMAQAQVVQAKLFDNPIITLEQNIYNRLNGKYFDLGKMCIRDRFVAVMTCLCQRSPETV